MTVGSVNGVGGSANLYNELNKLQEKNKAANAMLISGMGLTSCNYALHVTKSSFLTKHPTLSLAVVFLGGTSMLFGMFKSIATNAKIKELKNRINMNA